MKHRVRVCAAGNTDLEFVEVVGDFIRECRPGFGSAFLDMLKFP